MKSIKDVSYGPHGERNLLDLYLPDEAGAPRPLVICIHGGGWAGGDKAHYEWMAEPLVSRGFAVTSITYRFWPQWLCPAAMDDVQRAVRWLRKHAGEYRFDLQRFGAIGGSAGAHLASYLALTDTRDNSDPELAAYSSRVQCVVDCYGPVDFVKMMESASSDIIEGFLGSPLTPDSLEAYRQASPLHLIPNNPPPFLLVHGTADAGGRHGSVPFGISVDFCQHLAQAGGEATLLLLGNAPHGFSPWPDSEPAQRMWAEAVPFFEKHLQPDSRSQIADSR